MYFITFHQTMILDISYGLLIGYFIFDRTVLPACDITYVDLFSPKSARGSSKHSPSTKTLYEKVSL